MSDVSLKIANNSTSYRLKQTVVSKKLQSWFGQIIGLEVVLWFRGYKLPGKRKRSREGRRIGKFSALRIITNWLMVLKAHVEHYKSEKNVTVLLSKSLAFNDLRVESFDVIPFEVSVWNS